MSYDLVSCLTWSRSIIVMLCDVFARIRWITKLCSDCWLWILISTGDCWWRRVGGAPSEGGIVASSSFPYFIEPRFIEPVGLWNQQRGEWWRSLALRDTFNRRGPAHTQPKYFAPNGGEVVNLSGLTEHKAVNCMMKWNKCKSYQRSNDY